MDTLISTIIIATFGTWVLLVAIIIEMIGGRRKLEKQLKKMASGGG